MEISILQFIKAKGVGAAAIKRFCSFVRQNQLRVDELSCRQDVCFLVEQIGIKADFARSIVAKRDEARLEWDRLRENNVELLWLGSEYYPSRVEEVLGSDAPPYLFVKGNVDILNNDSIGVCGSRHASQCGMELANDIASKLAHNGIGIVSGNAAGVDSVSHEATLRNGGETIFVLPVGILNFSPRRETEMLLSSENHLVVSQFPPEEMWFAHNAMARNSMIVAISKTMLVVEAGASGGSLAAGKRALELGHPLFAIKYSNSPKSAVGNDSLIMNGAVPICQGCNGLPDLSLLIKSAKRRESHEKKTHMVQPSLFRNVL